MKILVVRVKRGSITIDTEAISSIEKGIAIFVGLEKKDDPSILPAMAEKVVNLRIFEDKDEKLAYSVKDKNYSILCIPNFTLCANTEKGRRPSFENSLPYKEAEKLFDDFVLVLKSYGIDVEEGVFGAYMDIKLDIDGPVNIILDSNPK